MKNRCPICKKTVKVSPKKQPEEVKLLPFCSQRCKLIDLGAWLDGKYKVLSEPSDTSPDTPTSDKE
ncbi:MAG: DNA gyrase inhibitor YacG [Planctomycetota bacterium]|nr:MAG: DNA gyrase inhibitor YacG [Planctomycetota bacterium]